MGQRGPWKRDDEHKRVRREAASCKYKSINIEADICMGFFPKKMFLFENYTDGFVAGNVRTFLHICTTDVCRRLPHSLRGTQGEDAFRFNFFLRTKTDSGAKGSRIS